MLLNKKTTFYKYVHTRGLSLYPFNTVHKSDQKSNFLSILEFDEHFYIRNIYQTNIERNSVMNL